MSQNRVVQVEDVKPILSLSLVQTEGPLVPEKQEMSSLPEKVVSIERAQIIQALEKCGWVQTRAAKLLGLTPRQMGYRIIKYGILPKTQGRTHM
jgi:Nif-specific regulatory protein